MEAPSLEACINYLIEEEGIDVSVVGMYQVCLIDYYDVTLKSILKIKVQIKVHP